MTSSKVLSSFISIFLVVGYLLAYNFYNNDYKYLIYPSLGDRPEEAIEFLDGYDLAMYSTITLDEQVYVYANQKFYEEMSYDLNEEYDNIKVSDYDDIGIKYYDSKMSIKPFKNVFDFQRTGTVRLQVEAEDPASVLNLRDDLNEIGVPVKLLQEKDRVSFLSNLHLPILIGCLILINIFTVISFNYKRLEYTILMASGINVKTFMSQLTKENTFYLFSTHNANILYWFVI